MNNEMKIGKEELIKWIKKLLKRTNFDFNNLKDGDVYLELFEYIWPHAMKKYKGCIYINPINDINKKKNWNLIKTILNNVNIDINFINYDEICKNNFIECYQSLIILYFLYSLVKNKECDFTLAYPINKELTNFMSNEKPLNCLINSKSVKLSECVIKNKQYPQIDNMVNNKMDNIYTSHINYINEFNSKNKKTEQIILDSNIFPKKHTNNNESQINDSSIFNDDFMHSQNTELTKSFYSQAFKKKVDDITAKKIKDKSVTGLDSNYSLHKSKQNNPCNENLFFYNSLKKFEKNNNDYVKCSTISNASSSSEKSESISEKGGNGSEKNGNNPIKTKSSLLLDKIYYKETKENEKKTTHLHNFNDIEQIPKSNFFKYFNIGKHINEGNENSNLILQELDPPFPKSTESSKFSNISNLEKENKFNLEFQKINNEKKKHTKQTIYKIDASSQTNENDILNIFLNNNEMNNFENIWTNNNKNKNNNDGKRIKSDYFIEYLKRQIKIYKKELDIKTNELELTKKIHEKEIKDINETHNVDLLNLKEKHNNEILYLKNENIENIISIKKKYEHKLSNIEDDLLLDLDVLIFENHNVTDSSENYKNNESKTKINKQINGLSMNCDVENCFYSDNTFEQSSDNDDDNNNDNDDDNNNDNDNDNNNDDDNDNNNDDDNMISKNSFLSFTDNSGNETNEGNKLNSEKSKKWRKEKGNEIKGCKENNKIINNNIIKVNKNIQLSIKKIKHLVFEKNKENRTNNEYINNKIVNLKNMIKNNNLEKTKNYNNLEQNKEIFQELLKYIEEILTKNEDAFSNTDKEESYLKQIKNTIYNIIKNKQYDVKNDEICKMLDKSLITRFIIHIIFLLAKEHIKKQHIELNIMKNISLKDYTNDSTCIDKKIKIFETVEKPKGNFLNSEQINIQNSDTTIIPSNEIIKYEKELEKYEKIKNLEKKNKKLLSINEYYKKKLEHTEIWKKSIKNLKKKLNHENNDIIIKLPNERNKLNESNKNYPNCLDWIKYNFAEFPKFYLKIFKEKNENDAELMFLLKKLNRCDNEPEEFNIFDEHTTEIYKKINKLDEEGNEIIDTDNIFLKKDKIEIEKLTGTDNILLLDWKKNNSEKIKKKLTYLFWKMLGDIYKYRNIIQETFNYVNNLNKQFNNYILENDQRFKTSNNYFENFNQKNINLYLSDKYKLRKKVGIEKLNANIYKERYIDLLNKYQEEKNKYIFLINSCHENENVKYKYTINQLKDAYFNLKKYQIREIKWNQLTKLLATQINAPSTQIEQMIKDVWIEILATNNMENEIDNNIDEIYTNKKTKNIQNEESNYELIKKQTNFQTLQHIEQEQNEKNNGTYLISLLENTTQKTSIIKDRHIPKKDKIKTTNLVTIPGKITNKNNYKYDLKKNNEGNNNNNKKKSFFKIDNYSDQLNYYKYDFNTCLQNIKNNKICELYSENEQDDLEIYSDINLPNLEQCLDEVSKNKNQFIESANLDIYSNENNINESFYEPNDLDSLNEKKKEKKNIIFLLSEMAKESCIMFQNILKIKEGELKEKEEKILYLEQNISELKQQNINEQNNFQRLEDNQTNLKNQLSLLRNTIKYLNDQILLLNKEKLYLQINYLEKQKELEFNISNYKNTFNQIKENIQNYPLILYLLETLDKTKTSKNKSKDVDPQEIKDIANEEDVQSFFQTEKNANKETDNIRNKFEYLNRCNNIEQEEINSDKIKNNTKNCKILDNFSNFTNPIFDEQNKNIPNFTLNDLINDSYDY
ncbi:calponin homology domain-containing protein, putative [Plasmodium berghei]|uniref:Calponin homology domain-containing protein, putative n=2 Tax=Plasmodium berghei TaxID=5821 RepID=A0A509ANB3_PLABA|nr:calponin homology domain-containing protein, putative [Plasmodium berghei ANKA]SCL96246.1 calponin homology domain-containing protein, putative [Plasmodium berghei]SCM16391.1 calponin homology domain-containing protein, putative [Plasmodium berghei]SCM18185.1 calponin homology domain-containing protein, putative [Plasmodium berghei]SCN27612.1 calponin homology domain-containing protein, putative [Plasmodium berghei]VUC57497.1 calponin homology domain-containing protein, putative [Plasmodium|eukprot:XP_034423268.1 calponin homology domain-containing protein, putative [Plasmodium berghei ANKA]